MKKNKTMIITFMVPALFMFSVVFIYPIIRTLLMSFFEVDSLVASLSEWRFAGLNNYVQLFNTPIFIRSMWNMFKIWAIGGVIVMSISLLFAAILNSGIRGKKFFRAAIYLPNVISAVALSTMWLQFVFNNRFGLLKGIFETLGLESLAAIQWTSPTYLFWAMLIAYCFGMVGYHMLIFSSGIEKIPEDFYSAAHIEGAGKFKQFIHITLPLIKGVTRTNVLMWSISSIAFFLWSRLFSSGNVVADTVITPLVYLLQVAFGSGTTSSERFVGLGAAIGVLMTIAVVIAFTLINKIFKDDDLEF